MFKYISTGLVLGLAGLLIVGASALAAPGGNGKGHGSGHNSTGTQTGTCAVTPNPLAQWEVGSLSGSGFATDSTVSFSIRSATGDLAVGGANTDASGAFSTLIQGWLGTNTVTVSGGGATATCTFQVV